MLTNVLIGASCHAVHDDSILDALWFARANGFSGIQVAVETPHLAFENVSAEKRSRIAAYREAHDLRICLHALDTAVSLFATSAHLREGTFAYFAAMLNFAQQIGSQLITVHPGRLSTFATDSQPRQTIPEQDLPLCRGVFEVHLQPLTDLAAERAILCIENFHMDALVREAILPHLNTGRLFLCWDLAKTYSHDGTRDEPQEEFFWRSPAHIQQVHLQGRAGGRSHLAAGTGDLDFMRYLPRLSEANVLHFCHEVRPRQRAVQCLSNLKALIAAAT